MRRPRGAYIGGHTVGRAPALFGDLLRGATRQKLTIKYKKKPIKPAELQAEKVYTEAIEKLSLVQESNLRKRQQYFALKKAVKIAAADLGKGRLGPKPGLGRPIAKRFSKKRSKAPQFGR